MVRGEAIVFLLTVFVQLNAGSVFDQFTTPEKKDKNKMLMFLRGLLKLDSPTTTPKVLATPVPNKLEQIWDSKSLADRSDKSKMLAYLRGMKAPNNMVSVYEEPQHRGLIQSLQSQTAAENTAQAGQSNQANQNMAIDLGYKNADQPVLWANPSTQITILQPEQESESDTCFWRGQQSNYGDQQTHLVFDKNKNQKNQPSAPDKNAVYKSSGFNVENIGDDIAKFAECMKIKFWKSYYKMQSRLCALF